MHTCIKGKSCFPLYKEYGKFIVYQIDFDKQWIFRTLACIIFSNMNDCFWSIIPKLYVQLIGISELYMNLYRDKLKKREKDKNLQT